MTFKTLIRNVLVLFIFQHIGTATIYANVQNITAFPAESLVERIERLNDLGKSEGQSVSYNMKDLNGKYAPMVEVETNNMEEWLYKSLAESDLTYEKKEENHYLILGEEVNTTNETREIEQQSVVTGLVIDAQNEPLIGVNILEKGTSNGTITNYD